MILVPATENSCANSAASFTTRQLCDGGSVMQVAPLTLSRPCVLEPNDGCTVQKNASLGKTSGWAAAGAVRKMAAAANGAATNADLDAPAAPDRERFSMRPPCVPLRNYRSDNFRLSTPGSC